MIKRFIKNRKYGFQYFMQTSTTLLLLFLLISCGNRKSPTGGPVDLTKPTILYTEPLEFEQIEKNEIIIAFSKPMDKTSVMNGLTISPPTLNKKMTWKKSTLHIVFQDKLAQDKNIIINLSTTIRCERNNNLENDIMLVYRNGELQLNSFSGYIVVEDDIYQDKEIQISLLDSDSLLVFSRITEERAYRYEYLNPGKYSLISYIDYNNNRRYDFGTDPFAKTSFELPTTQTINIALTVADTVRPNVVNVTSPANNQIIVNFNKEIDRLPFLFIINDSTKAEVSVIYNEFVDKNLYLITTELDSSNYRIQFSDLNDKKGNNRPTVIRNFMSLGTKDTISPKILEVSPKNGSVVKTTQPEFTITFDKILFSESILLWIEEIETNTMIHLSTMDKAGFSFKYKPITPLKEFNTYQLIISIETCDMMGNKLEEDMIVQFIVTQ